MRSDAANKAAWDRGIWLAGLETAIDSSSLGWEELSAEDRSWLSAARLFPLSDEDSGHPDPLVASMGRLRLVQVRRENSKLPAAVADVLASFKKATRVERESIGAAALFSVARVALRSGAWKLLGAILPGAAGLARAAPHPRRLSVATGLATEWALALGDFRIACLYASECLFHGSERQRVRGYLGLAYAMAGCWDRARLLFEEAWAAQNLQPEQTAKAPFGALNLIRLDTLRSMAGNSLERLEAARNRLKASLRLFDTCRSPVPEIHARLAIALAARHFGEKNEFEITELGQKLADIGRLRDFQLLEVPTGDQTPDWLQQLEALASSVPPLDYWVVDESLHELASRMPSPLTSDGFPAVLFCI